MARHYVTIVAPENVIAQLQQATAVDGVELGKSRPADALSDAADSPLGPEEIKQILQVVTVAFSTGSAALTFWKNFKATLGGAKATVKEGRTGRRIADVDEHSDPEDLASRSTGE